MPPRVCFLLVVVLAHASLGAFLFNRGDNWLYGEVDNIKVLSNASEGRTEELIEELRLFRPALGQMLAVARIAPERLLRVLICRNDKTLEQFRAPEEDDDRDVAGYYFAGDSFDTIVIDANVSRDFRAQLVYHEYTHRLLPHLDLPLWADEGFAEVFSTFEIRRRDVRFGRLRERALDRFSYLEERSSSDVPLSLERMFRVTHSSKEYRTQHGAGKFYITAYLFTHYSLFLQEHDRLYNEATPGQQQLMMGHFYLYSDLERAWRHYLEARDLLPHDPAPRVGLGLISLQGDRFEKGEELLREAVDLSSQDPFAHVALAERLFREHQRGAESERFRNTSEVNAILVHLYTAMQSDAGRLDLVSLLAQVWLAYDGVPPTDHLRQLLKLRQNHAGDPKLNLTLVRLLYQLEMEEQAAILARSFARSARGAFWVDRFCEGLSSYDEDLAAAVQAEFEERPQVLLQAPCARISAISG